MLTLRCSKLPLHEICPASAISLGLTVERHSLEAKLGTAVHAVISSAISTPSEFANANDVADFALHYAAVEGVDAEELVILSRLAWRCWERLQGFFPFPETEVAGETEIGVMKLSGHVDLRSFLDMGEETEVRVLDWKTGRVDSDHTAQLKGYALLALAERPEVRAVRACLVRVREQTADWFIWEAATLRKWAEELVAEAASVKARYTVGKHCSHCPARQDCPAFQKHARTTVAALMNDSLRTWDGEDCADILQKVQLLESICADAREAVKVKVRDAGGVLRSADGRELALTTVARKTIDAPASWPTLRKFLPEEIIRDCCSVKKGEIERAVADTMPRGQKTRRINEMMAELGAAGAIITSESERLEVRRSLNVLETA